MMYDYNQLRRDAAQLEIDLHDLARGVDRVLPDRCDISYDLRFIADRITQISRDICVAEQGIQND